MKFRTTALALTALAGTPNAYAPRALEELVLPRAEFSEPDEEPPAQRPVLNVLQSGAIVYRGEVFYDPGKHTGAELEARAAQLLLNIRSAGLANQTLSLTEQASGAGKVQLLDDPILIRADKWAPWRTVRAIMKQCSRPEIAFWKIQLGAAELDRETGQHNPRLGAPAPKTGDPGDDVRFAEGFEAKVHAYLPIDSAPVDSAPVDSTPADSTAAQGAPTEGLTVSVIVEAAGKREPSAARTAGGSRSIRFRLVGHKLSWRIGETTASSLEDLRQALTRTSADPTSWIQNRATGGRKLMRCVIEASPDACNDDVMKTHDAICAAGFTEIHFSARPAQVQRGR